MLSRSYMVLVIFNILLCFCVCANGNSELNVKQEEHSRCSFRQFTCANKECIPIMFMCDNEEDCSDGSDEDPKECSSPGNFNYAPHYFYGNVFSATERKTREIEYLNTNS